MSYRGVMIGCGHVADFQLAAWRALHDVQLVAVADLDAGLAQRRAAEFGIERTYTDYQQMIDAEKPDFVDIATPPHTHRAMVGFAAEAGLPVLCQKPIASDLATLRAMIDVTERAGVLFMVNENGRFQPAYRILAQRIARGDITDPFYANFSVRKRLSLPEPRFQQAFFKDMPRLIIYELGVHVLDTMRYLFGEPERIAASTHHISPHIRGEDVAVLHIRYPQMTVVLDLSWASLPTQHHAHAATWTELHIETAQHTIYLQKDGTLRTLYDERQHREHAPKDSVLRGYIRAQRHFIDCLKNGTTPETSGRETLKTMELVFGAYHAAEMGTLYRVGNDIDLLA